MPCIVRQQSVDTALIKMSLPWCVTFLATRIINIIEYKLGYLKINKISPNLMLFSSCLGVQVEYQNAILIYIMVNIFFTIVL